MWLFIPRILSARGLESGGGLDTQGLAWAMGGLSAGGSYAGVQGLLSFHPGLQQQQSN